MRTYSGRDRLGSVVLVVVSLATAILGTMLLVARPEMRTIGTWAGAIGAWGAAGLFAKIAATGTSWRFFERRMDDPFAPPEDDNIADSDRRR